MQVIPDEGYDGEETRDGADDEAAVDQTEVFDVFVLLQEDLFGRIVQGIFHGRPVPFVNFDWLVVDLPLQREEKGVNCPWRVWPGLGSHLNTLVPVGSTKGKRKPKDPTGQLLFVTPA